MARSIKSNHSKTVPKRKLARKSSMEKCIVDAEDFLRSTKTKKIIKKTRNVPFPKTQKKKVFVN